MRILSVNTAMPYPPVHAVSRRTWHLLRELAAAEEVTVLTWADPATPREHLEEVRRHVADLIVLPWVSRPMGRAEWVVRQMRAIVAGPPYFVQGIVRERATAAAFTDSFDLVVAEDEASVALMPPTGAPVVVHRLNVLSATMSEMARCESLGRLRAAKYRMERRMWERYDRVLAARADLTIAVTDEIAERLRMLAPASRVAVVPQGAGVPAEIVEQGPRPVAAFIGNMDYPPNVDAVMWFARTVWPLVRAAHPGAEFRVVGRNPDPRVRAMGARDGIVVTGEVTDVVTACSGAWAGVSPLRAGWGVKTKSMELMGMGLPLVTTSRGAEGIRATEADGVSVADRAESFAAHLSALFADPAAASSKGLAARAFIQTRMPWDGPPRRYLEVLRSFAAEHSGVIAR